MKKVVLLLQQYRYFAFFVFLILFSADIFAIKHVYDCYLLFVFFLWLKVVFIFKIEARFSILAAFFTWFFSLILLLIGLEPMAEKSSIWTYLFLLSGVIQLFIEQKKDTSQKVVLKDLWTLIKDEYKRKT